MTTDHRENAADQSPFRGIIPPIVTPLRSDGTVDVASLERLTEHLISAGVDGVFVLGSSGEVAYLTDRQRLDVVETVVKAAAGRVPVIAGAMDFTAHRVVERALPFVDAGVHAIVATAPIYAINDLAETAQHFRLIARSIGAPLLAYDVPVRVHAKLPPELLVDLGREGVIVGCKDSSGDDVSFRRLIALNADAGSPLQLLTGHEVVVDGMALAGADGAVPGLANVDPAGYVRLWRAARSGDWDAARAEQERLNALFAIVFAAAGGSIDRAGVGAFKAALVALGIIDQPAMAAPVASLDAPAAERVRQVLRGLDLVDS